MMDEGTIVTFYSYKGGVGRTLALANIGAVLCRWGYRVLCVDWDLEAPGLHLYFEEWLEQPEREGLVNLVQAHVYNDKPKWQDYVTSVQFPDTDSSLSLITAGLLDTTYVERLQSLDWMQLYEQHDLGNFLEQLRNEWRKTFDFVLIDSRTGITDIGGICTVQMPDLLVLLFTANEQSLSGAIDVVRRAKETRNDLPFDRGKLLVLPVPTRFEARVEYELAEQWLNIFAHRLAPLYSEWVDKSVAPSDLLNFTRIPYIPFWSFGEKLPVIEKGTQDPEDIGFSLETLAALIAQRFESNDVLVRNRDSFVTAARQRASIRKTEDLTDSLSGQTKGVRVFLSYSHRDEALRHELTKHLSSLSRRGVIEAWHDRKITAGSEWGNQIDAHLEEADIILLLVSADFLASDYCYDIEMARAVSRHEAGEARVIPIILRPTYWEGAPFGKLQALPTDAKAVVSWRNRDEAFTDVVRGISAAVASLRGELPTAQQQGPPTHIVDQMYRGDFITIAEAIHAANPGDRILIRPGLYQEELVINKSLEIIGDGERDEVVIQGGQRQTLLFQATRGRVANLTLRHRGTGNRGAVAIEQGRLELEDCDITSNQSSGIIIHSGADPRVRHNYIHDNKHHGVLIQQDGRGALEDNDIANNAYAGVLIKAGGNSVLRRNRITKNDGQAIVIEPGGAGMIEDNDLRGNAGGAWHIPDDMQSNIRRTGNMEE